MTLVVFSVFFKENLALLRSIWFIDLDPCNIFVWDFILWIQFTETVQELNQEVSTAAMNKLLLQ
jgi:hypothetical protein